MSTDDDQPVRGSRLSDGAASPELKPIVLDYSKWKKRDSKKPKDGKPQYSKGLEDAQRLEGDVLQVAQTGTRALSKSLDTYVEERRKSAKKKKDGAIEDFLHNSAKASSTFMKEASDIPVDVADSISRLTVRKNLRKAIRRASKRILTWPI